MKDENQSNENDWGVYINHKEGAGYHPLPEWLVANKLPWTYRGVAIWDKHTNRVKWLFPQQALDVLDDLKEWVDLEDGPFYLDWDSYTVPFSEEDRTAWRKTKNRRNDSPGKYSASLSLTLSPQQARGLLQYLGDHQTEIREVGDEHVKEANNALGSVYSLIMRLGRGQKKNEQKSP